MIQKEGSAFYLKKAWPAAKQKTFGLVGFGTTSPRPAVSGSFFASFFSKKEDSFFGRLLGCFVGFASSQ
jgi:hypothetical protein